MNLVKLGALDAAITVTTDKHGYEHLLAVAKVTFSIEPDGSCAIAEKQKPLVYADEFYGEPGLSATLYESDFAPFKPRCDVLLNGSAYSQNGQAAKKTFVSLRVGSMDKSFEVTGNRVWEKILFSVRPSDPQAFYRLPISYNCAYGGVDVSKKNADKNKTYSMNPVGVGYYPLSRGEELIGKPLPNTSEIGRKVKTRTGKFRPMAFGAVGRNFKFRYTLAGTYDQKWLDTEFPFLPADFDPLYHQSSPPDQQIVYPKGGEKVELVNLSPDGHLSFILPKVRVPVKVIYRSHHEDLVAVNDTLILEPDERRCIFVCRASRPLNVKLAHVNEIWVGEPSRARLRAHVTGKRFIDKGDI